MVHVYGLSVADREGKKVVSECSGSHPQSVFVRREAILGLELVQPTSKYLQ